MSPPRTPRRPFPLLVVLACLAMPFAALAGAVLTGTVGAESRDHFKGGHFAYSATLYAKIDDMTLLGVQSGMGALSGSDAIPILASALIRLPLGRVVLPVATGDVGYVLDDAHPGLLWRGGGGFDIRNGRHSSFLLLGAYEGQDSLSGWCARAGLLLEF
jgi:hypothetical protein